MVFFNAEQCYRKCGIRMSVHPKNTSLGEVRLAGGSHACDRRESQFGMKKLLSALQKQLILNNIGAWGSSHSTQQPMVSIMSYISSKYLRRSAQSSSILAISSLLNLSRSPSLSLPLNILSTIRAHLISVETI